MPFLSPDPPVPGSILPGASLPHHPALRPALPTLLALRSAAQGLRLPLPHPRAYAATGRPIRFRGRGMDYRESRAYQPGDEIRHMDWRVLARRGVAHTKLFEAERDRPALLLLDLGPSMFFGTRRCLKSVQAAHAAMLLAWALVEAGDRVGAMLLADGQHRELRPRPGVQSALTLARALCRWTAQRTAQPGPEPETLAALLRRTTRPGTLLIVLSDLQGWGEAHRRALAGLIGPRELLLIHVEDPLERGLPTRGRIPLLGADGAPLWLDCADMGLRAQWQATVVAPRRQLVEQLAALGAGCLRLSTEDDPAVCLRAAQPPRGR